VVATHQKARFLPRNYNRGIEEPQPNRPITWKGIIMTSNTLDTPKVSAGFDINAEFRSVMHDLGLSPEDTGGSITFIGEDPIFPTVPSAQPLDDGGVGHATALAHGLQSVPTAALLQGVDWCRHDAGTASSQRVADGDSAAVHVGPLQDFASLPIYVLGPGTGDRGHAVWRG
jgi:hypothetical protein